MSTSFHTPAPGTLGAVPFKNNVQGGRVAVTLEIMDLVRTKSDYIRAIVDLTIVPIGLQLLGVPILVRDGKIAFSPSRRDFPRKGENEDDCEFTFGFVGKAQRDIFGGILFKALEAYCHKHHHKSLEDFLELRDDPFDKPSQGTPLRTDVVRPPSPSGGIYGQRYVDRNRHHVPGRPAIQ